MRSMDTSAPAVDVAPTAPLDGRIEGFRAWLLQRVTGALLAVLLGVHIVINHFWDIPKVESGLQEELILFEIVKDRLAQAAFILVDFSLLALALYHGLNGLRGVLLEWRPARERSRAVNAGLLLMGLAGFAFGARVLLVFIA